MDQFSLTHKFNPMSKFEINLSKNHQYFFVLKSGNGEKIATSELYKTKQACKKGISAVRKCLFSKIVDLTI